MKYAGAWSRSVAVGLGIVTVGPSVVSDRGSVTFIGLERHLIRGSFDNTRVAALKRMTLFGSDE